MAVLDRSARLLMVKGWAPSTRSAYRATYWAKEGGLSWQQVGAAHGWQGATVKRYIMVEAWKEKPGKQ